jgi:two-component system, chemotaxis family, CheB/CheR fusion protein
VRNVSEKEKPVNEEKGDGGGLTPREDNRMIVPVVGIGASAGGLEVFKRLLADLSGDTGFAIVLVQHLAPNHPSILSDILARATPMPVTEAADGVTLEANHVYVMPANADMMLMACGVVKLTLRTQTGRSHMPIDCFLRSLADHCGSKAIGIILSGTGSDGSAGLEAIKAADGVTFAQEPATAKFAAMPQAAITAGCVDLILPPEGIAAELNRIGQHSYIADDRSEEVSATDEERFAAILAVLRHITGIDFSRYREKMVRRRILRRLVLRNINGLEEYRQHLENNPEEVAALQRDLLISVTSFFRDGEAFDSLKKVVFPRLLQGRTQGATIRVWSAGCATGEEAFSLAILLQEYLSESAFTCAVQIFASDLSLAAIEKARVGRYPESIAADITPERLNRYFGKIEGGYQILKGLRDTVVFARHNLLQDPPFSKLDLITCRNVLIYLAGVQKDIIPLFHYALKPNGFLMLGAAEAAVAGELFSEADREHRIYSKRETVKRRALLHPGADGTSGGGQTGRKAGKASAANADDDDARKQVDRLLLSRYSPASVLVDEDLEVLEIRGKPNPYLTLPAGKVSFNLIKLLPDTGLFLEVQQLVLKAAKTGETERRECLSYEHEGSTREINVEAVPLNSLERPATLVLFEAVTAPDRRPVQPSLARHRRDTREREISQLKRQLDDAKERFLSLTEGHQTYREESQNTTEEALSANEELQSLNEELETAKEELQSTNEELITVNDELQAKNTLLAQARDFALSIVETVRQPLLVLDAGLRIRMANRAFYRTFHVSQAEAEGQDIFSLGRGVWDVPALRDVLNGLLQDGNPVPDFELERDFPDLGRRSLVIGGCRINHLKMILLAVDDITEHKVAQHALRISEEHLRQSQKMEAVGRLAGGIAHDFNNLLTTSIGYSSLLYDRLSGDPTGMQYVLEIQHAGQRAASLTQQLLAFSRRQVLQPKVFDLNTVVSDFDRMLRRLVGERIKVVVKSELEL